MQTFDDVLHSNPRDWVILTDGHAVRVLLELLLALPRSESTQKTVTFVLSRAHHEGGFRALRKRVEVESPATATTGAIVAFEQVHLAHSAFVGDHEGGHGQLSLALIRQRDAARDNVSDVWSSGGQRIDEPLVREIRIRVAGEDFEVDAFTYPVCFREPDLAVTIDDEIHNVVPLMTKGLSLLVSITSTFEPVR